ncbi:FAD-binding oxidoreductase [Haladaptatus sp. DYSN1]|uniref:NAD(P)/FAD-dependent oxidoreductase n=1 Tax=unclassified Haladaptatus TaxID=2622732 RepID=UPI002406A09E|nr:FAD-dependent oxidoreductase [Haladaptatus sp. DYSN1]
MDAVVVGGGVVGLACAHYLTERGAAVTVLEKGSLGGGSTGRSAGGIRAQFSTPVNVDLSVASMAVWDTFEAEFGVDIAHRKSGYLFLAREADTADAFRENVAMQNERGVPSEVLSPTEAEVHCPGLRTEEFVLATYSPTDGFADPNLAVQGFAQAVTEAGGEIRTKTPVTDVLVEDEVVVGVETPDGELTADVVVNAAGAWAGDLAAMAGLDLPIAPRRRQIAIVQPETPLTDDHPLTIDLDTGSYFRPEREDQAIVGGHFADADRDVSPDRFSEKLDMDWAVRAVENAGDCATNFGLDSRIVRGWAGLYAVTPDHHPIIEESMPGFLTVAGFSGHGFQHSPAVGNVVTELVFDGKASLVDVSGLSSERFERGEGHVEQNVA